MKIYRIDNIPAAFRPDRQGFVWPPQNQHDDQDFGVEQDFDEWLLAHPDLLCDQPADADWVYLPLFWNRYFFNALDPQGHWGGGLEALNEEVQRCRQYGERVFTIAEADVRTIKPSVDFGDMLIFCASRREDKTAIDIPLLSGTHAFPDPLPSKKWLACFQGNLETDGVRMDMRDTLEGRADCKVEHAGVPEGEFVQTILEGYIALAPRGQGAQSFRFYEAMQLGVVPLHIGEPDCRPFKNWIDWDSCSMWLPDSQQLLYVLDNIIRQHDWQTSLKAMGRRASITYSEHLAYGRWCKYVVKELEFYEW